MEEINPIIVQHLRDMARRRDSASQILRELIQRLSPEEPHIVTLMKYMRKAFSLSLQQVSPVAGWSPDGTGELQDAQLDKLVMPEILKNRPQWDFLDLAPSA
jgi:hypothetical protein